MARLFKRINVARRTRNYVGTVVATLENMRALEAFRQALRGTGRSVYLQGRNKDRKMVARMAGKPYHMTKQNVPHQYATSFDVYWRG